MVFQQKFFWRSVRVLIVIVLAVASLFFAFSNQHVIRDYFAAQKYKPDAEISKIENRIKPTTTAKTVFYASNPKVENSEEFNQNCKNHEEGSAILGCYKSSEIHIYDVKNSKLDGVKDVTAAHELLHAIWDRMSLSERDRIGKLLDAEYERVKDSDFEKLMQSYDRTEPGERINELHSLIGTEQLELSKELEDHYAKFFENRKAIAQIYQSYNKNFKDLRIREKTLTNELEKIKSEIEQLTKKYSEELEYLNTDIAEFNSDAKNGTYKTQSEFNADRTELLRRIRNLENSRLKINDLVNSYNFKINELNEISVQRNELYKSINSNLSSPSL